MKKTFLKLILSVFIITLISSCNIFAPVTDWRDSSFYAAPPIKSYLFYTEYLVLLKQKGLNKTFLAEINLYWLIQGKSYLIYVNHDFAQNVKIQLAYKASDNSEVIISEIDCNKNPTGYIEMVAERKYYFVRMISDKKVRATFDIAVKSQPK